MTDTTPGLDTSLDALSRLLSRTDPLMAALVAVQAARLASDSEPLQAREAELLRAAENRPGLSIRSGGEAPFSRNLTVLEQGAHTWAWIADDDIFTLSGGAPGRREDPWAGNKRGEEALAELLGLRLAAAPDLRLFLFGGLSRLGRACAEAGLAQRVTHLALQTQDPRAEPLPLARCFPAVRGLRCSARELPALLAEGAPTLESLVVTAEAGWVEGVLDLALRAPALRHLGLWHAAPNAEQAERLVAHPLLPRLASLELFDVAHAARLPFEVLARAPVPVLHLCHHQVPPERLAAAGPRARGVGWDRREAIARDFQSTGWGGGAR